MLKIEVVKFEAQDVITASVACTCPTVEEMDQRAAEAWNTPNSTFNYYDCFDNNHYNCPAAEHHCPPRIN